MLAAYISTYDNYRKTVSFQRTIDTLDRMENALSDFFGTYGRYPCPANRRLDIGDQLFGHEIYTAPANINLRGFTSCDRPCQNSGASNADELQISGTPIGVICVNEGTRDVDLDGSNNDDWVMIGTVPVATLFRDVSNDPEMRLEGDLRFDGQGMQITYAVTEGMTGPSFNLDTPANPNSGTIDIVDENNRALTDPASSGHYVLVSHGINSRGAFSDAGVQRDDCLVSSGPPVPATPGFNPGTSGIAVEIENCDDNDGIYVKGLYSLANGDAYFDDFVEFRARSSSALWRRSNTSTLTDTYIYNTNLGRVGVNNNSPNFILDVIGNIKVEDTISADGNICDSSVGDPSTPNNECLNPSFVGGDMAAANNTCPAGQVAVGVEMNELICEPILDGVTPVISGSSQTCTSSTRALGFDLDINTGEVTLICGIP